MQLFYDAFIRIYAACVWLASPFNPKAKKWFQGRKKSWILVEEFRQKNPKNIWVHCASVGEFEQGLPLIEKLQKEFPTYKILLSFFSPSGYELVAKKHPELQIIYLPSDTKNNSNRWINTLNPSAVFFIKYEFWHHYFFQLKNKDIPLFMVSAIFWKELFFFRNYASFFRKALRNVTHFFVQNEESKKLLYTINIENVSVNGDLRFERVLELKNSAFSDERIEKFKGSSKLFIAGSAWNNDIPILKNILASLPADFKIIIAPHEVAKFDYDKFQKHNFLKYTEEKITDTDLLFLDTLGLLSKVYRYADLVYIGGGFGTGIHNILEPAVYNVPILFGPNNQRFAEAQLLKKSGLATELENLEQVSLALENSTNLPPAILEENRKFFEGNTNASAQIVVFIKKEGILP